MLSNQKTLSHDKHEYLVKKKQCPQSHSRTCIFLYKSLTIKTCKPAHDYFSSTVVI